MELRGFEPRSSPCHGDVLTTITTAPLCADNFGMNILASLKQLWNFIKFALGLVRWYNTPEAKLLLASLK